MMKAKKRYLLVLASVAFLVFCYFGGQHLKRRRRHGSATSWKASLAHLRSPDHESAQDTSAVATLPADSVSVVKHCRMSSCFDLSRCSNRPFRVYVYPVDEHAPPSQSYRKVLDSLRDSHFYTADPDQACLFVLSLDTLDRDPLSNSDYVRNMQTRFAKLKHWNGGVNHVIFNLYAGTYPDYSEDLGFDVGKAILAKASMSVEFYRPGFDVSIPLFHKNHPERGGDPGLVQSNAFPVTKKHFLAFKGKRYLYGIGSDTRNSLYHLHNGDDVVMVTTCKHGKNWKELKDERCDLDNQEYERWDYDDLLANSTFCLVPRGRRLGSYRFIETLQAGCVPVILSNGWKLPFAEVIDWSQATIQADERLLLQIPELLRSVSQARIFAMRQQTQVLWDRYLSSVQKIVLTTVEIIKERVLLHQSQEGLVWNSDPGALLTRMSFSDHLEDFPTSSDGDPASRAKFTALIYQTGTSGSDISLNRLLRQVAASRFAAKIVILWTSASHPASLRLADHGSGVMPRTEIVRMPAGSGLSARFFLNASSLTASSTDALLSLDDVSSIITEEIDFAFHVWQQFPDRIVGFDARSHYWNDQGASWSYSSRWSNEYSMVLTRAAFMHRYYYYLYIEYLPPHLIQAVDQLNNCEDILMNFLVSHVTQRLPIKVTQRKSCLDPTVENVWNNRTRFMQRQTCMNTFVSAFGYMPLKKSISRFDPHLYQDAVKPRSRKKYRKLDSVRLYPAMS